MLEAVIDNDVLGKTAVYDLLTRLPAALDSAHESIGVLGAAQFVLRRSIERRYEDHAEILAALKTFLDGAELLEPEEAEVRLAIMIEEIAAEKNLQVDGGESLLCAIACLRDAKRVATGDKRAVESLGALYDHIEQVRALRERVVTLEAIFISLLRSEVYPELRNKVCSRKEADKALSICFSCSALSGDKSQTREALESYHSAIEASANGLCSRIS